MITAKLWAVDEPTLINKNICDFIKRKLTVMNKMGIRFECKIIKDKDRQHLKYKGIKTLPVCIINSQRLYADDIPRGLTNMIQKHRQKLMEASRVRNMSPEEQMQEYQTGIILNDYGWKDEDLDNNDDNNRGGIESMSDDSVRSKMNRFVNARNEILSTSKTTPKQSNDSYYNNMTNDRRRGERSDNISMPSTGDEIKDAALATGNTDDLLVANMFESTDDRPDPPPRVQTRTNIVRNHTNYRPF
jgi:hypothetical protein